MRSLERDEKREKEQLEKKNHKKHKSNFSRTRSNKKEHFLKKKTKTKKKEKTKNNTNGGTGGCATFTTTGIRRGRRRPRRAALRLAQRQQHVLFKRHRSGKKHSSNKKLFLMICLNETCFCVRVILTPNVKTRAFGVRTVAAHSLSRALLRTSSTRIETMISIQTCNPHHHPQHPLVSFLT